jgi:hypothetical protein
MARQFIRARRLPEARNDWSMMIEITGSIKKNFRGKRTDEDLLPLWRGARGTELAEHCAVFRLAFPRHLTHARLRLPQGRAAELPESGRQALLARLHGEPASDFVLGRVRKLLGCVSTAEAACKAVALDPDAMQIKPDLDTETTLSGYAVAAFAFEALGLTVSEKAHILGIGNKHAVSTAMNAARRELGCEGGCADMRRLFEIGILAIGEPFTPEEAARAAVV